MCVFPGWAVLEREQGSAEANDSEKKYPNNILGLRDVKWKLTIQDEHKIRNWDKSLNNKKLWKQEI